MAKTRKRLLWAKGGRRRWHRVRGKGPKQGTRYSTGFLGRVFNTNWLFGRNRYRRKV